MQRSTDNLWDRSLYSAGTDSPAKQNQQARRRRLDTQEDDDATAGTSGASTTPRRRLSSLPNFAKPPQSPETARGKRLPQHSRTRPSLSPLREQDEEDQPTQSYTSAVPERRARTTDRRRAAAKLPTTFDDEEEEEDQTPPAKNKRPLRGPPTAKTDQPDTLRTAHHPILMRKTSSPFAQKLQTPNHHSKRIARGRPQQCRMTQIWTTTSWGLPPEPPLKAPFIGATGTSPRQPKPANLRSLQRANRTPQLKEPKPKNSLLIPSRPKLTFSHKRKRTRTRTRNHATA